MTDPRFNTGDIERIRAEAEAGQADTERLNDLSEPGASCRVFLNARENIANPRRLRTAEVILPSHVGHCNSLRPTLRAAIDAAAGRAR